MPFNPKGRWGGAGRPGFAEENPFMGKGLGSGRGIEEGGRCVGGRAVGHRTNWVGGTRPRTWGTRGG